MRSFSPKRILFTVALGASGGFWGPLRADPHWGNWDGVLNGAVAIHPGLLRTILILRQMCPSQTPDRPQRALTRTYVDIKFIRQIYEKVPKSLNTICYTTTLIHSLLGGDVQAPQPPTPSRIRAHTPL